MTLALAGAFYPSLLGTMRPPPSVSVVYIRKVAAGAADGSSWANAGALASLNSFIQVAAIAHSEIWIRADEGTYAQDGAISISQGGAPGNRVVIRGVDANGVDKLAELVGSRASPWSAGLAGGSDVFRLNVGADHLEFAFLRFRNQGKGCIRARQAILDLCIRDCDAYNVQSFFENSAADAVTDATVGGLQILRCQAHGYSKVFARIQFNSYAIQITDCLGDSERQDKDNFASGIVFYNTAHDAVITRTFMNNHIDTTKAYQNGDGFAGEHGNHNISLIDCGASGNTDGGIDFKGDGIYALRFRSEGNHRNYRLWGYAVLEDCVGIEPRDNAGTNPYAQCQVGAFTYAMVRIIRGSFTATSSPDSPMRAEAGGIISLDPATVVTKPSGVPLSNLEPANNGGPPGQLEMTNTTATTAPVITSANSLITDENKLAIFQVTTSKLAQLRVIGGRDAAQFTTFGNQLRLSRQDYESPAFPDETRQAIIQVMDGNGVLSSPMAFTANINNVDDAPIAPADLAADGCTDFLWADFQSTNFWQDAAGTIPAGDGDPVARIDDQSGHGHHWTQSDVTKQGTLVVESGITYLDADNSEYLGTANSLKFPQATVIVCFRRASIDTSTHFLVSVPRSLVVPTTSNYSLALGTIGGSSTYFIWGSATTSLTTASGGLSARDAVASLRTTDGTGRLFASPVSLDQPYTVDAVDVPTIAYTAQAVQPRLGCDGNSANNFIGRIYGIVVTNRAETDDFRFRIERQLAQSAGIDL